MIKKKMYHENFDVVYEFVDKVNKLVPFCDCQKNGCFNCHIHSIKCEAEIAITEKKWWPRNGQYSYTRRDYEKRVK